MWIGGLKSGSKASSRQLDCFLLCCGCRLPEMETFVNLTVGAIDALVAIFL